MTVKSEDVRHSVDVHHHHYARVMELDAYALMAHHQPVPLRVYVRHLDENC